MFFCSATARSYCIRLHRLLRSKEKKKRILERSLCCFLENTTTTDFVCRYRGTEEKAKERNTVVFSFSISFFTSFSIVRLLIWYQRSYTGVKQSTHRTKPLGFINIFLTYMSNQLESRKKNKTKRSTYCAECLGHYYSLLNTI
jgi:hypothetical protein